MSSSLDDGAPEAATPFDIYEIFDKLTGQDITDVIGVLALIFVGAMAYLVQRHIFYDGWMLRQSKVYQDFWSKEESKLVRYWLVTNEGYDEIKPILEKRFDDVTDGRDLDWNEYWVLETIDVFLSDLTRFREFDLFATRRKRRVLWKKVFNHWRSMIISRRDRREFKRYVRDYWGDADLLRDTGGSWFSRSKKE